MPENKKEQVSEEDQLNMFENDFNQIVNGANTKANKLTANENAAQANDPFDLDEDDTNKNVSSEAENQTNPFNDASTDNAIITQEETDDVDDSNASYFGESKPKKPVKSAPAAKVKETKVKQEKTDTVKKEVNKKSDNKPETNLEPVTDKKSNLSKIKSKESHNMNFTVDINEKIVNLLGKENVEKVVTEKIEAAKKEALTELKKQALAEIDELM